MLHQPASIWSGWAIRWQICPCLARWTESTWQYASETTYLNWTVTNKASPSLVFLHTRTIHTLGQLSFSSSSCNQIAATTSHWWCRLVNTYEVRADMVYLQGKSCVIHTWALKGWGSHDEALYKSLYNFTCTCTVTAALWQQPHSADIHFVQLLCNGICNGCAIFAMQ